MIKQNNYNVNNKCNYLHYIYISFILRQKKTDTKQTGLKVKDKYLTVLVKWVSQLVILIFLCL